MRATGRLLGSGRTADVYEIDEAWVLRRDRAGYGDAAAEGAVMEHVRRHGFPAPRVRAWPSRTELVMERLSGPTMLQAWREGSLGPQEAGAALAGLLRRLHEVPPLRAAAPADRVLHLDLHPDNVILAPDGPRVIDWTNSEEGPPGLDWGTSAVILAQVAAGGGPAGATVRATLAALLADPSALTAAGLAEALRRRAANPTMTPRETGLLGAARDMIEEIAGPLA